MTAQAGTDETASGKESKAVVEEAKKSYISGDLGVQFVSTYYSRGILQGPQGKAGFDAQPYLDLYFQLYAGTGFVDKVTLNLGLWSNLASDTKPSLGGPVTRGLSNWTEFDWMPGVSFVFAKNFTLTVSYFEFDYPSQGASPQRSINTSISYDDTDLLGMWALHPHFTYLQELTGNANGGHVGLGFGGTSDKGQYYEVGIAPAFTFMKDSKYAPTLTIPVTAGFGSSGFYGTGFGYASAGLTVSVPLAFIPSGFGAWTANFGGTYYYLGTNTARANGQFSNSGVNHDAGVGFAGVGLTF
ncbi:MAG: hypothetical protein WCD79_15845 [Chthoniobacteraceae bacterium]